MGRFSIDMDVANQHDLVLAAAGALASEKVRHLQVKGIVDCGATHLVLPETVATQLGLVRDGTSKVSYADRRTVTRHMVRDVQIELLGRQGTFRAIIEPDRTDALIGAIVLEDLDFVIDPGKQRLTPRDPEQISAELE